MPGRSSSIRPVSPITSLNAKLALLVLVPAVVLGLVTIGSQHFLREVGRQALADLSRSHAESQELSAAARSVRTQVMAFTHKLIHFLDHHERALLSADSWSPASGMAALRTQASTLAGTAMQALEPIRRSFTEGVEANVADGSVLADFDRRYVFILRTARNLPRLLDILAESHGRTTEHLARGETDRARSQYIHEEQPRARTLKMTTERLTGVLDELTVDVEAYIGLKAASALATARTDARDAMGKTFWWIAITIVVAVSVAVVVIRLVVSEPMGNFVSAMLRLAKGDLDVEISDAQRRDEIGALANALGVFKKGAIERQKIEKDLADYRDHLEDLVEQRTGELEKQKIRIEEALIKERELSGLQRQFVAMVSHEFRTPLAIIDGNAQRLLRRRDRMPADRLEKALTTIRLSVHRLVDLMESVLSAARLEGGQIRLDPKPCSPVELVRDVAQSYLDLYPDRAIHLDLDALPERICADDKLLRQVVSNIISNAIKYSPGKSAIWIAGTVDPEGRAVVSVRDEGVGIPQAEVDKLFERFFRASTSTGIAGSGIGLNLAYDLVRMHGGTIDLVSAEGEGTTFFIRLPIAGPPAAGDDRPIPASDDAAAASASDDRDRIETLVS